MTIIFQLYKDPVRVTVYKKIEPVGGKPQFCDLAEGVERVRQVMEKSLAPKYTYLLT